MAAGAGRIEQLQMMSARARAERQDVARCYAEFDRPLRAFLTRRTAESLEMLKAALHAIGELRPKTRKAFLDHRITGSPQSQIAAAMGISVGMVERHVSIAMAAVREAGEC